MGARTPAATCPPPPRRLLRLCSTLLPLCKLRTANVFCFAQDDDIETENKNYQVSKTVIKDKSLLGTHAQKLCENIDVHWMHPACSADSTDRKCS